MMVGAIIAVDPGLKGGIACIRGAEIVFLEKMPVIRGAGRKTEIDAAEIIKLFEKMKEYEPVVYLEKVGAYKIRGRSQGVVSMFNYGKGFGILIGVTAALKIPVSFVTPQRWKKVLDVTADKGSSILRAKQLFPDVDLKPGRCVKDHDGLAEALLIAVYGGKKEWR
jgi:crossover junction endodeoxyribonuclease RuvC